MLVFEAHGTITAGSARRRRLYRAKRRFPRLSFASFTFCVSLVPQHSSRFIPSREEDSSSCCWWIESFFRNRSTNPLSSPWNFSSLSDFPTYPTQGCVGIQPSQQYSRHFLLFQASPFEQLFPSAETRTGFPRSTAAPPPSSLRTSRNTIYDQNIV